jgi:hypothetical protein
MHPDTDHRAATGYDNPADHDHDSGNDNNDTESVRQNRMLSAEYYYEAAANVHRSAAEYYKLGRAFDAAEQYRIAASYYERAARLYRNIASDG